MLGPLNSLTLGAGTLWGHFARMTPQLDVPAAPGSNVLVVARSGDHSFPLPYETWRLQRPSSVRGVHVAVRVRISMRQGIHACARGHVRMCCTSSCTTVPRKEGIGTCGGMRVKDYGPTACIAVPVHGRQKYLWVHVGQGL